MKDERGSALIIAMFVLVLAGSVTALIFERARGLDAATRHDRESLQAFYAAEGGLARARHALAGDPTYVGETLEVGGREVAVTVAHWTVVVLTRGCRIDAQLELTAGLPRVVSWRARS